MTTEQTALVAQIESGEYYDNLPASPDYTNDESLQSCIALLEEKKTELEGLAELPDLPTGAGCYITCEVLYVICRMAGNTPEDEIVCRMNRTACNSNCGTAE